MPAPPPPNPVDSTSGSYEYTSPPPEEEGEEQRRSVAVPPTTPAAAVAAEAAPAPAAVVEVRESPAPPAAEPEEKGCRRGHSASSSRCSRHRRTPSPGKRRGRSRSPDRRGAKHRRHDKKNKKEHKTKKEKKGRKQEEASNQKGKPQSEKPSEVLASGERPGVPTGGDKDGPWGPWNLGRTFMISQLPSVNKGGQDGREDRVSCPSCWQTKPRNTLWLHLMTSSTCRSWQEKGANVRSVPCSHCGKLFHTAADRDQHAQGCGKQKPAEPRGEPSMARDSEGRRRRSSQASRRSAGSSWGSTRELTLRSRRRRSSSGSRKRPVRPVLRSRSRSRRPAQCRSRSREARDKARPVEPCTAEKPADPIMPEPAASGSATVEDRKLAAYERLLSLGEKVL